MWDLLQAGGPVMWAFPILSVIAVAIIIDRLFYFHNMEKKDEKLLENVEARLALGKLQEARDLCVREKTPFAKMVAAGIAARNSPGQEWRTLLLETAQSCVPDMERHVSILGTISNISPLLGLLGTVLGNIEAFNVLNRLQGIGDPARLAEGIAMALYTTVGGILVAVPCVIFYNLFVTRATHTSHRLENSLTRLQGIIQQGRRAYDAG